MFDQWLAIKFQSWLCCFYWGICFSYCCTSTVFIIILGRGQLDAKCTRPVIVASLGVGLCLAVDVFWLIIGSKMMMNIAPLLLKLLAKLNEVFVYVGNCKLAFIYVVYCLLKVHFISRCIDGYLKQTLMFYFGYYRLFFFQIVNKS